ncbi:MAG: imidazolonepropionase [Gammaproteobacteria bacterium RIFCSPHIGHO2_12_FULL_45_9]|nr:MAG: imidazolonepropionase [Gammaproteobacteria bacterium RIFCSPHIGHO2_12_FULL_45_9]
MSLNQWDSIWINALLASCENSDCLMAGAALAVKDGKIAWLGAMHDLRGTPQVLADQVFDVAGRTVTPGLIDCHTHLVYAGNRAGEFEARLRGVSYAEIARQGGGIQATVKATRAASEEALLQQSLVRAKALMASGVTTLEIKSGYGLDVETEIKMLRVAKRMETLLPISIRKTFLGAHTVPMAYAGRADAYVDYVCDEMMPCIAMEGLADAVDVFCESIAFNLAQTERIFQAAQKNGLAIKCHAEQLSDSGGAALAAAYGALSADHLEYVSEKGIMDMAGAGTVAVLLPGAFYFLRETQLPPMALLRQHQVPIAIASDCNPGTSPVLSMLLILNMACTLFRMQPMEALLGATKNAAAALGLEHKVGTLAVGKQADFAVWEVAHPCELAYYLGGNPLHQLIKDGCVIRNQFLSCTES